MDPECMVAQPSGIVDIVPECSLQELGVKKMIFAH